FNVAIEHVHCGGCAYVKGRALAGNVGSVYLQTAALNAYRGRVLTGNGRVEMIVRRIEVLQHHLRPVNFKRGGIAGDVEVGMNDDGSVVCNDCGIVGEIIGVVNAPGHSDGVKAQVKRAAGDDYRLTDVDRQNALRRVANDSWRGRLDLEA